MRNDRGFLIGAGGESGIMAVDAMAPGMLLCGLFELHSDPLSKSLSPFHRGRTIMCYVVGCKIDILGSRFDQVCSNWPTDQHVNTSSLSPKADTLSIALASRQMIFLLGME